jgi:hypothetical protein
MGQTLKESSTENIQLLAAYILRGQWPLVDCLLAIGTNIQSFKIEVSESQPALIP